MLGSTVAVLAGYVYATRIEPDWVAVEKVELTLPRLDAAFDGFRLVQISDIHLSERLTGEQLARVALSILELKPDLVAITGDFVDEVAYLRQSLADIAAALQPLASQVQIVAVLGNHDYWTGAAQVRIMLHDSQMMELDNRVLHLQREGKNLFIGGVDDLWEGRDRIKNVLKAIGDRPGAAVLLAHEPDFADEVVQTGRFDLRISGHSHGGQVVLPFFGPPVLPYYGERYHTGLYQLPGMLQYTNRGLGTAQPRVRFNCRPEITLFTLRASL